MPNVDENLNAIFNVGPSQENVRKPESLPAIDEQQTQKQLTIVHDDIIEIPGEITEDHERTRANFYALIEKGNDALGKLLDFAKDSENPRAYEVLATLLKNVGEINEKIMAQHQTLENIRNKRKPKEKIDLPGPTDNRKVVNNSIFVGSTKDLQEMIKKNKVIDYES